MNMGITLQQAYAMYDEDKPVTLSAAKKMAEPTEPSLDSKLQAAWDTFKDLPNYAGAAAKGFGTGLMDLPLGAAQFGAHLIGKGESMDQWMNEREQSIRESAGEYTDSYNIARATGQIEATLPLAGAGAAATLGGRVVAGAKAGAMVGAAAPVVDQPDYWREKAFQTGSSAAFGAVAPVAIEGVVKGLSGTVNWAANKAKGLITPKSTVTIERQLQSQMKANGVSWQSLPKDYRSLIVQEVRTALANGGQLDDAAVARIADFQKLGMQPTRGQASRDPYQFSLEQNNAGIEAGLPLRQRLTEQNAQLIGSVDRSLSETGKAKDLYTAGHNVMDSITKTDADERAAVSALYEVAKSKVGMQTDVPVQPIADRFGKVLEEYGQSNIPGDIYRELTSFGLLGGNQTKVMTLGDAERLRKLIGNNIDPVGNRVQARALGELKAGIDDAVNLLADSNSVSAEAAAALVQARDSAAQRFSAIRANPARAAIVEGNAPSKENFIRKFIVGGTDDEVGNIMKQMEPEARKEAQAGVISWLRDKSVSVGEDARFSQDRFNRALGSIGDRKLAAIFGDNPELLDQLRTIGRVGEYVQKPPIGNNINTSKSATTFMDAWLKASRLPGVGFMLGDPAGLRVGAQVQNALRPAPVVAGGSLLSPEKQGAVIEGLGLLGTPAAAVAPIWLRTP
jgi:hypothetical protein